MTSQLGPAQRQAALDLAAEQELDVLVVGGGVVGAGAALDAATRGLRVGAGRGARLGQRHVEPVQQADPRRPALLEMLDFGLVREALSERGLLLQRLAPHLVRPVPFLYPLQPPRLGAACTPARASRSTTRWAGSSGTPRAARATAT